MKRLKRFGLCLLITTAAMAAVGASAASASWLVSQNKSTTLKAVPTTPWAVYAGNEFNCAKTEEVQIQGTQSTFAAEAFTASGVAGPSCNFLGPAPFKWNGCLPTFRFGSQTSPGVFAGTMDIGPAGCGPITIANGSCKFEIKPRTGLKTTYTNLGSGSTARVEVNLKGTGLEYSKSGGCGSKTGTDGRLEVVWELKGYNESGTQVGIHASGFSTGFYVAGEASEEAAKQPKFTAEHYPVKVDGSVTATHTFTTAAGKVQFNCPTGAFGGENAGASASLSLSVNYGSDACSAPLGGAMTVNTNGCTYDVAVANSGPPYVGTASIACKGSEPLKLEARLFGTVFCTISYPAQALGAVTYENTGSGSSRSVVAKISGSGLQYTRWGSSSCGPESGSDGTFSGTVTLKGSSYE